MAHARYQCCAHWTLTCPKKKAAPSISNSVASPRPSIHLRASHAQSLHNSNPCAISMPPKSGRGRMFISGGPARSTPNVRASTANPTRRSEARACGDMACEERAQVAISERRRFRE
eukprot:scaffold100531_cov29-Tisochrysis_lutea.AAC.3